jgi:radical SAM superfamily enzyme YgiQ (UPF0313 family)
MLTTARMPDLGTTALHYGDLRPPMGLGYISALLEKNGIEVKIVDNYVRPRDMKKEIDNFKPDLIGLYMHTPGYYVACDLIDELKDLSDAPLMVGGPHASLCPETIPSKVDYICQGEGEFVMLELCRGETFPRVINNAISGRIKKLDDMPFPNYDHFWGNDYNWRFDLYGNESNKVFTMHTSRSCPYRCTFCGVDAIWTRRYTFFSAQKIVEEIDHYVEKYGVDGIYFREDLFTANHKRLKEVCDLLIERPYSINWACEARADITDKSLIEKMYESGCRGMYLGVESGNDEGLKKKKKDLDLKTMRTFFGHANDIGLATYATFCIGTPGETEEEVAATEDFIEEIKPTSYDKFAYLGLPKSQDYNTLLTTKDYYHIDAGKIIYSDTFYDMAHRLYDKNDQRLYFLKQQKKFLNESRGYMSQEELANHRFPAMDEETIKSVASSRNDHIYGKEEIVGSAP